MIGNLSQTHVKMWLYCHWVDMCETHPNDITDGKKYIYSAFGDFCAKPIHNVFFSSFKTRKLWLRIRHRTDDLQSVATYCYNHNSKKITSYPT